ncbi:MAG: glycosyl transferase, partial [Desulfobacterales bacterium]
MKIVLYCQHVLGIGHFFRTLEISRALSRHEVILVSGGPAADTVLPEHVQEVRLPEIQMGRDFKGLFTSAQNITLDQVKQERQRRLFTVFEQAAPDLFIVELYPFGRKAFRFELDPILLAIRNNQFSACRVVCSLRDILVEKENNAKHEMRVINTLNSLFDAVLVHSDPKLCRIEETFTRTGDIGVPIVYTGFITPRPPANARRILREQLGLGVADLFIVASAGGGNVGAPLLEAVIKAVPRIPTPKPLHLRVFTGPLMDPNDSDRLKRMAGRRIVVRQFTRDFLAYLAAADLSVSMAGYNT